MPWNLNKVVKEKAIEIANSLVEDGYDEGRGIPIAIDEAEKTGKERNMTPIN
ncbi:hypothetical protein [Bacillus sp. FJAT-45037]|uniref:hypothetical protein n=1 Tax=Bacillus sp. FJAT-45037 TaxID=2011007 RepID=UPI001E58F99F|nr:hypothetical protein [Bacillus sp. FJAT-45037]